MFRTQSGSNLSHFVIRVGALSGLGIEGCEVDDGLLAHEGCLSMVWCGVADATRPGADL